MQFFNFYFQFDASINRCAAGEGFEDKREKWGCTMWEICKSSVSISNCNLISESINTRHESEHLEHDSAVKTEIYRHENRYNNSRRRWRLILIISSFNAGTLSSINSITSPRICQHRSQFPSNYYTTNRLCHHGDSSRKNPHAATHWDCRCCNRRNLLSFPCIIVTLWR